jgi:hypothetical protein
LGEFPASHRWAALALVKMPANGWLTSVSDRCREFSKGRDPIDMSQFVLGFAQRNFLLIALDRDACDVRRNSISSKSCELGSRASR